MRGDTEENGSDWEQERAGQTRLLIGTEPHDHLHSLVEVRQEVEVVSQGPWTPVFRKASDARKEELNRTCLT